MSLPVEITGRQICVAQLTEGEVLMPNQACFSFTMTMLIFPEKIHETFHSSAPLTLICHPPNAGGAEFT